MGFNFALVASAEVTDENAGRPQGRASGSRRPARRAGAAVGREPGQSCAGCRRRICSFLKSLDADVVLMRPDFVVYGHADRAGLSHLTESLLQLLQYTSTRAQHRGP